MTTAPPEPVAETWIADPAITWTGHPIGYGTSHAPGADEWSETRIYRTAGGTYIITGRRYYEHGDRTFDWLNIQRSARNVVKALSRVDRNTRDRFLPLGSEAAVESAATVDPAIRAALDAFDLGE